IGETIKGFEATAWQGLFAPAGTPKPVVDKLAAEAKRIWGLPAVQEQLKHAGADVALSESPEAFVAFTRAQRVKWGEVVKASGVKRESRNSLATPPCRGLPGPSTPLRSVRKERRGCPVQSRA